VFFRKSQWNCRVKWWQIANVATDAVHRGDLIFVDHFSWQTQCSGHCVFAGCTFHIGWERLVFRGSYLACGGKMRQSLVAVKMFIFYCRKRFFLLPQVIAVSAWQVQHFNA
jgi:hypothetical protein